MACRCNDIYSCQMDINTMASLAGELGVAIKIENNVLDSYDDLSLLCNWTFIVYNNTILNNKLKYLNDDILEAVQQMASKCNQEATNLQAQLSAMKSEDTWYHEEQARLAREAEEAAEEAAREAAKETE